MTASPIGPADGLDLSVGDLFIFQENGPPPSQIAGFSTCRRHLEMSTRKDRFHKGFLPMSIGTGGTLPCLIAAGPQRTLGIRVLSGRPGKCLTCVANPEKPGVRWKMHWIILDSGSNVLEMSSGIDPQDLALFQHHTDGRLYECFILFLEREGV